MHAITPTPYQPVINNNYSYEVTIDISATTFTGITYRPNQGMFFFSDCSFRKLNIVNYSNIKIQEIGITFHCCIIDQISVEFITTDNISLHFSNCLMSGAIRNKQIKRISINNCICNDSIFLLDQNNIDISYTEENIYPRSWNKIIRKSQFDTASELIKLKQSYFIYNSKKILFRMNEAKNKKSGLYIQPYQQSKERRLAYYLTLEEKSSLNINLNINYSIEVDQSSTQILNSALNSLSLKGDVTGKLLIENVRIDSWCIHQLSIKSEATFYLVSPRNHDIKVNKSKNNNQSTIEIHKSNLDKSWFDNVNFNKYDLISFYRTRVGKANFTGCEFPEDLKSFEKFKILENIHFPDKLDDNYYKNHYEFFLQLKATLESTGNTYEAQKMQSIANESLRKIGKLSFSDKAILKLNSLSNRHGISLINPILWFLGWSSLLYILYLWSFDRIFNYNKIDYQLFGYYFSFIDPTHRTDFLCKKEELTGLSLFIDFISKIILGFLIYQFIAVFRKHGKSK